jgi:membrane glycosyltransferase
LLSPVSVVAQTIFLAGLACGRAVRWAPQRRHGRAVSLCEALSAFWPQTLAGVAALLLLGIEAPWLLPWATPFLAGLVLAVPFAWLTSHPGFDRLLKQLHLCASPEEAGAPSPIVAAASGPSPAAHQAANRS